MVPFLERAWIWLLLFSAVYLGLAFLADQYVLSDEVYRRSLAGQLTSGQIETLLVAREGRELGSLLLMSLPWVLLNASRPLIGWRPRTMTESILVEPPEVILFANWTNLHAPFAEATELIRESGCRDVGLRIDSGDIEYAFWWLLDAPQSGIRLEQVDPYPHLARYAGADFTPCAILCTVCGGRTTLYGLEVAGQFPPVSVFLGNGYTSDIDS